MIDWFLKNSQADYLFKIDDDCYVNYRIFDELISLISGDYIGKTIKTKSGPDRHWHKSKSKTNYAKFTPDLSPDKTFYCDGGIGYFLSRKSCEKILEHFESLAGRILEKIS